MAAAADEEDQMDVDAEEEDTADASDPKGKKDRKRFEVKKV